MTGDDFQVIYQDTPGVLTPAYMLHVSPQGLVCSDEIRVAVLQNALLSTQPFANYMTDVPNADTPASFPLLLTIVGLYRVRLDTTVGVPLKSTQCSHRYRLIIIYHRPVVGLLWRGFPQEGMMNFVTEAMSDADAILFVTDIFEAEFSSPQVLSQ